MTTVSAESAEATDNSYPEALDHEDVVVRRGRRSGLYTIVAVHSTIRGPSLGGCRMWGYADARQALRDALRLSRAMTFKSAVADLPLGGGKGVIMTPPGVALHGALRTAALLDFGDTVESLDGRYITAEDVGTSSRDMRVIAEGTGHVAGLPLRLGGSGRSQPVHRARRGVGDPGLLRAGVRVQRAARSERGGDRARSRGFARGQAMRPRRRPAGGG